MAKVENGVVILDTHNAYGYKRIPATKIAKKLNPNAKEKDGQLLIPYENSYICPVSGNYVITVGIKSSFITSNCYLNKGDVKYFSSNEYSYIHITRAS